MLICTYIYWIFAFPFWWFQGSRLKRMNENSQNPLRPSTDTYLKLQVSLGHYILLDIVEHTYVFSKSSSSHFDLAISLAVSWSLSPLSVFLILDLEVEWKISTLFSFNAEHVVDLAAWSSGTSYIFWTVQVDVKLAQLRHWGCNLLIQFSMANNLLLMVLCWSVVHCRYDM